MVQGRPNIQKRMSLWCEAHLTPEGSLRRYQYSIFDKVQVDRATVNLEEASTLTRAMPRADMIIIAKEEVRVLELKPTAQLQHVGAVLQYVTYLKRDIFLAPHLNRPIVPYIVTLKDNAMVRAACEAEGIRYVVIPLNELPDLPTP
jgi:nucleoside-triphosphatase THEP1